MNSKHVEYIIAAVQYGSITSAAKALFISQQAMSQAIRTIEEELGVKIFQRSADGVQLTEAGNRLYPIFYSFYEECRSFQDKLDQQIKNMNQTLIIRLRDDCIANCFPQELLSSASVHIQLELDPKLNSVTPRENGKETISTIIYDVLSCRGTSYKFIPVQRENIYVVMHKEHLLAGKEMLSIKDILNENILLPSTDTNNPFAQDLINEFRKYGKFPSFCASTHSIPSVLARVRNKLGINLSPLYAIQSYDLTDLKTVLLDPKELSICLGFFRMEDSEVCRAGIDEFIRSMVDYYNDKC